MSKKNNWSYEYSSFDPIKTELIIRNYVNNEEIEKLDLIYDSMSVLCKEIVSANTNFNANRFTNTADSLNQKDVKNKFGLKSDNLLVGVFDSFILSPKSNFILDSKFKNDLDIVNQYFSKLYGKDDLSADSGQIANEEFLISPKDAFALFYHINDLKSALLGKIQDEVRMSSGDSESEREKKKILFEKSKNFKSVIGEKFNFSNIAKKSIEEVGDHSQNAFMFNFESSEKNKNDELLNKIKKEIVDCFINNELNQENINNFNFLVDSFKFHTINNSKISESDVKKSLKIDALYLIEEAKKGAGVKNFIKEAIESRGVQSFEEKIEKILNERPDSKIKNELLSPFVGKNTFGEIENLLAMTEVAEVLYSIESLEEQKIEDGNSLQEMLKKVEKILLYIDKGSFFDSQYKIISNEYGIRETEKGLGKINNWSDLRNSSENEKERKNFEEYAEKSLKKWINDKNISWTYGLNKNQLGPYISKFGGGISDWNQDFPPSDFSLLFKKSDFEVDLSKWKMNNIEEKNIDAEIYKQKISKMMAARKLFIGEVGEIMDSSFSLQEFTQVEKLKNQEMKNVEMNGKNAILNFNNDVESYFLRVERGQIAEPSRHEMPSNVVEGDITKSDFEPQRAVVSGVKRVLKKIGF